MMNGTLISHSNSRLEAYSQPKCMSSPTQFAALVQGQEMRKVLPVFAGQSIDFEWHVFSGDISVQMLNKLTAITLATGEAPESVSDRSLNWESQKV